MRGALQLEHDVPGGLSEEERERLFDEEAERARQGRTWGVDDFWGPL